MRVELQVEKTDDRSLAERGKLDQSDVRRVTVHATVDTSAVLLTLPQDLVRSVGLAEWESGRGPSGPWSGHRRRRDGHHLDRRFELRQHVVTVGRLGRVQAEVSARSVVVLGRVQGDIRAGEKVSIGESGRVDGVVSAPRLAVADGAHVQGRVETQARRADRTSATGR